MKKTILILTFMICGVACINAQTTQGSMMLGGSIGFSSVSYDENNDNNGSSSVTFAPGFGYFVADNFAVGANLSIYSARQGSGNAEVKTSSFGFAPFARYYKFTSNDRFAFIGQAAVGFASGTTKSNTTDYDISEFSFSISPGFAYFFNEHWAAELMLAGLEISSSDNDFTDNKRTEVSFGLSSFNPSLGVRYHF